MGKKFKQMNIEAKPVSIGELIDKMPINEIIYHEDFCMLSVYKYIGGDTDYWEITFKSKNRNEKGYWVTFYNQEIITEHYKCYKIKKNASLTQQNSY